MKYATPVIVTRKGPLPYEIHNVITVPVLMWDNSQAALDLKVFGRYAAVATVQSGLVYVQDDDVIVPKWRQLVDLWEPGQIVCNMAPDFQQAYAQRPDKLVGHGAVFDVSLVKETFDRYFRYYSSDEVFLRECDRIFTALNQDRLNVVYVGHESLPCANNPDRLWKDPNHCDFGRKALERVRKILELESKKQS